MSLSQLANDGFQALRRRVNDFFAIPEIPVDTRRDLLFGYLGRVTKRETTSEEKLGRLYKTRGELAPQEPDWSRRKFNVAATKFAGLLGITGYNLPKIRKIPSLIEQANQAQDDAARATTAADNEEQEFIWQVAHNKPADGMYITLGSFELTTDNYVPTREEKKALERERPEGKEQPILRQYQPTLEGAVKTVEKLKHFSGVGKLDYHLIERHDGLFVRILTSIDGDVDPVAVFRRAKEKTEVKLTGVTYRNGEDEWDTLSLKSYDKQRGAKVRSLPFGNLIDEKAKKYDIDPLTFAAVIGVESHYKNRAGSHAGAQGLCQLMPATAKELGVQDAFDPEQNLDGGAKYLNQLKEMFDGDLLLTLSAYNAGMGNVKRNKHVGFKETRDYVHKIVGLRERFAQDSGTVTYEEFIGMHKDIIASIRADGAKYLG